MERYRISEDAGVYFVTMSVVDWLPVLVSEATCRLLVDSLNFCHEQKRLRTNAYVFIRTHFHAIFFMERFDPSALQAALTDFRKFTGRRLSDYCTLHMPACFREVMRRSSGNNRDRRFWQPTLHPERIETQTFYEQKRDYLHDNPRRKGLVARPEYWRFTSASTFLSDAPIANDVILSWIDW